MGDNRRAHGISRRLTGLLAATLLGAAGTVVLAPPAAAAFDEAAGHRIEPGQPWKGRTSNYDWLGSYTVNGEQVFCVSFALKEPDTDEEYKPGDELLTKWGEPLPDDHAANISYLLLRYGKTTDNDEAAALAHLLHSWTAAPRDGKDDLNESKTFREIGYDIERNLGKLPEGAREAVERLERDAEANRGPWTAKVTPAEGEQTIGTPAEWTVTVENAKGKGVPDVPITLELTDAEAAEKGEDEQPSSTSATPTSTTTTTPATGTSAKADQVGATGEEGKADEPATTEVTTGEDGTATVRLTPKGEQPKVVAKLAGPAERPYVREPVEADTQRIVSTGGETELVAEGTTKARTQPGVVRVTKKDTRTGDGIAGVALRLTAADKEKPATGQDGKPLTGPDGKPVVVTTGEDGTATIENLRTPQEVCIVEVGPPNGYDQGFDPAKPPGSCGTLQPGQTLAMEVTNVPNKVPRTIPAGQEPVAMASSTSSTGLPTGALIGLGALALLGSVLVGWVARRRFGRN